MKRILFPFVVIVFGVLCSCTKDDNVVTVSAKSYLTLWNQCEAVTALQEYVEDVTNPSSKNFIRKEDRIATFDMDANSILRISSIICWRSEHWRMLRIRISPPPMSRRRLRKSETSSEMARPCPHIST